MAGCGAAGFKLPLKSFKLQVSFRFSLEHEEGLTSLSSGSYQLKSARGEIILPRRVSLETNAITLGQLIKLDVILINEKSIVKKV